MQEVLVAEVSRLRGEVSTRACDGRELMPTQLLLPPSTLAREADASRVYALHYAQEKQRLEERNKRRNGRQKEVSRALETAKRPPPPRRRLSQEAKNLAKPLPPAAVAVVVEVRKMEDPGKDDIALLEKQLAANRRASVTLQRSIVQKAIVNAASSKKEEKKEEKGYVEADLTSTSLDSTADSDEDDERNPSFATAQLLDEDLPKPLRGTGTGTGTERAGEEDSDIEIIDRYADRRSSFVGARGAGPPGEGSSSSLQSAAVAALATEEPNDTSETKEEILEVFRTWGGREAVEAAEAGDAVKVRRAIEQHSAARVKSMNLSPRSRDRDLFGKLQMLIKSSSRSSVHLNKSEKLSEARQRLAVSLQRNQDAARVAQEAESESRSTKTAQEKALTLEEEDDAYRNFTIANQKIKEILDYKNKVQVTEEDNGVSFVDCHTLPADDVVMGSDENVAGEMEQKMQLINHLLLSLIHI